MASNRVTLKHVLDEKSDEGRIKLLNEVASFSTLGAHVTEVRDWINTLQGKQYEETMRLFLQLQR